MGPDLTYTRVNFAILQNFHENPCPPNQISAILQNSASQFPLKITLSTGLLCHYTSTIELILVLTAAASKTKGVVDSSVANESNQIRPPIWFGSINLVISLVF
jgi:hypothetical protein